MSETRLCPFTLSGGNTLMGSCNPTCMAYRKSNQAPYCARIGPEIEEVSGG